MNFKIQNLSETTFPEHFFLVTIKITLYMLNCFYVTLNFKSSHDAMSITISSFPKLMINKNSLKKTFAILIHLNKKNPSHEKCRCQCKECGCECCQNSVFFFINDNTIKSGQNIPHTTIYKVNHHNLQTTSQT